MTSGNGIPSEVAALATLGFRIIPVHGITDDDTCTCGKDPCPSGEGKHPRISRWQHGGTTDLDQIEQWVASFSVTNWGVVADNLVVIDVDPRNGGDESMVLLQHMLPPTLTQDTGGGGVHYVYRLPDGVTLHNGKKSWKPGVDVLSGNTQFLVAPSRHVSGEVYSFRDLSAPVVDLPPDVLSILQTSSSSTADGSTTANGQDLSDVIAGLPEGERDAGLFRAACRWRRLGLARSEVEALVLVAAARCTPPLPKEQAMVKVEQAFKQDHDDIEPWMMKVVTSWANAAPSRLNLQRASEVRKRKKSPMLVENVLPPGGLFQIFGQTGELKSFVVVDLLCSVANGIQWMGHKVNADDGLVALVLGEGGWDAGNRIDAWMHGHPDCTDDLVLYSIEEGIDLMDEEQVRAIISDLLEYRDTHHPDKEWRVIVFDTQADHMPNGDEDKSRDFTVMKLAMQGVSHATGAAVGTVHHTGWDDSRERGSSRQRQALDVVMQVKDLTITNKKQKFAEKFHSIKFATETVEEADSIYVRLATDGDAMRLAFESVQAAGQDEPTAVKALKTLHESPGISGKKMIAALGIQAQKWATLRSWLEMEGHVACTRDENGTVKAFAITDTGVEWLMTKGAE